MHLLCARHCLHDLLCKWKMATLTIKSHFCSMHHLHLFTHPTNINWPYYVLDIVEGTGVPEGPKMNESEPSFKPYLPMTHITQSPYLRSPVVWFLLGTAGTPFSSCPGCHALFRACLYLLPPLSTPFTLQTLCSPHPQSTKSACFTLWPIALTSLVVPWSAFLGPEFLSWEGSKALTL